MIKTSKMSTEGAIRLSCAILEQCVHDWHCLRRDGIVDKDGRITGWWPKIYKSGKIGGWKRRDRSLVRVEDTLKEHRGRTMGAATMEDAVSLRGFLLSIAAEQICEAVGVNYKSMLEKLGLTRDVETVPETEVHVSLKDAASILQSARAAGLASDAQSDRLPRRRGPEPGGFYGSRNGKDAELIEFRRARNLSQIEAAKLVGVHANTWARQEAMQGPRTIKLP